MLLLKILNQVLKIVQPIVDRVELKLKAWTKPVSETSGNRYSQRSAKKQACTGC